MVKTSLKNYRLLKSYGCYFIQEEIKYSYTFQDVEGDFLFIAVFLLPFWKKLKAYQPFTDWQMLKLPGVIDCFETEETAKRALTLYLERKEIINL